MKFIADAMLGRLAKWLRFLGIDVLYYSDIEDRQIIRIAKEQGRTILTRDTGFLRRKGLKDCIFIKSDNVFEQLSELRERIGLDKCIQDRRCPICNGVFFIVSAKEEIREFVPDHVYRNHNSFMKCSDCCKVYWEGTHHQRIREKMSDIIGRNN
ncbi:MAG: hypothetical protein A2X59_03350 [Nitrospirae bacterium GWC2_42_7]|nr:MAG: hypothetical protein A2X59_03350 [Nitrospirae bacterium GWC2_42_7]